MPGKPQKKGRGVASAFLNRLVERRMVHPKSGGPDYEEGDHEFRGDGAMVAKPDATAVRRPAPGGNVLSTMDKYGVQDIVRNLSEHPTPAEAQSEFERRGGSSWNPADPYSADNPEVAKTLRALARKRKLQ